MTPARLLNENDVHWQSRLVAYKARTDRTYMDLAILFKCQTTNLMSNAHGRLKIPQAVRVHLSHNECQKSFRDICLDVLGASVREIVAPRLNDGLAQSENSYYPLSGRSLAALAQGDEYPAWNEILNELKDRLGSDQLVADMIETTRAVIGHARRSERRLPFKAKMIALNKTKFLVNDDLLLSLLSSPAIIAMREISNARHEKTPTLKE